MEACYGGTDVIERSCAVARGIDINTVTVGFWHQDQVSGFGFAQWPRLLGSVINSYINTAAALLSLQRENKAHITIREMCTPARARKYVLYPYSTVPYTVPVR
jgi:hypothetical protein